jgi:azurin
MLQKMLKSLLLALLTIGLVACEGREARETADRPAATGDAARTGAGEAVEEVVITPIGNEMRYEVTEFTVQAGQEVRVVFRNTATSPAMHHNVVVLENRAAIERVGMGALEAGEANDYIPDDDAIIAHTPMAAPGETVEVTFTAPDEPGDYPYICTFPGHYMLMQGTMHVQ